jgi:hypothetical protein
MMNDVKPDTDSYAEEQVYFLNENRLDLTESLKIVNHSPTGFNHGYSGSGPAQLALAICCQLYGKKAAIMVYKRFKSDYIAPIQLSGDWSINLLVPDDILKHYGLSISEDYCQEDDLEQDDFSEEEALLMQEIEAKNARKKKENIDRYEAFFKKRLRFPGSFKYEYDGFCGKSLCYVNLIKHKGRVIIIATDAGVESVDAGTSVTNAVEIIANSLCKKFDIDPLRIDFIERYLHKVGSSFSPRLDETWDKVFLFYDNGRFVGSRTEWSRIEKEEWKDLEMEWFDKSKF